MGQKRQSSASRRLENTTVVDVDMHLTTPFRSERIKRELVDRLDEPYRSYLGGGFSDTKGYGGEMFMTPSWSATMGGKEAQRYTIERAENVNDLREEFHIDYPIINALLPLHTVQEPKKALTMMRGINDILVEDFLDQDDDFHGLITISDHKPEAAAEEIDRLGDEDQVVGVFIYTVGTQKPLGDPFYDIIYQAAEDNDLAVAYHAGADLAFARQAPVLTWGVDTYFENHVLSHPWAQMLTLTSLIVHGAPVKFPDLNFVFLETGIGWIPYMMGRINREYGQRRSEAPLLEKSPEKYIRDFYFSTQPLEEFDDPETLKLVFEQVGADSLMFSSDFPHQDWDNPETINKTLLFAFDDDEREKVLYRNAVEAFGLEL